MTSALIYVGIAVGVAAIATTMVYGTENQKSYIPPDAVKAPATLEGAISSSGLGPTINKEQWHEDPFGDLSAKIRGDAVK